MSESAEDILKGLGIEEDDKPSEPPADTAPKTTRQRKSTRKKAEPKPEPEPSPSTGRPRTPAMRALEARVTEMYALAGMGAFAVGDQIVSNSILQNAESCADAWITLAERDPKVKRILERLTQSSAWGGVVMAHLGIAIPILSHYGILPGGPWITDKVNPEPTPEPTPPGFGIPVDDPILSGSGISVPPTDAT